ncbi:MAG: hydrogenase maturation nickel metallochaperone HypA [Lachnospiraceae bacterium]|nr:hydrogenase maturation nickel metallochaperone HypA [Lachnospiraceae bacterium]
MHELSIVFHIIKTIEQVGEENKLEHVNSVTLEVGEVSAVIDEYLGDCWKWAADRSELLKGARLVIEKLPAVTMCETCERTYATVQYGRICPYCGSERTYLLSGREINIKEIEVG